jgi:hypothetical protein
LRYISAREKETTIMTAAVGSKNQQTRPNKQARSQVTGMFLCAHQLKSMSLLDHYLEMDEIARLPV